MYSNGNTCTLLTQGYSKACYTGFYRHINVSIYGSQLLTEGYGKQFAHEYS